jgi:hypothetical protein
VRDALQVTSEGTPEMNRPVARLTSILPFAVILTVVAGCMSPASRAPKEPPPPPLANFTCNRTVAAFLAPTGAKVDQLTDVTVHTEPMAGGDQIAHYVVTARPPTCSDGKLQMVILPDCSVASWKTTPPCRLPELEVAH